MTESQTTNSASVIPLGPGIIGAVSADGEKTSVFLSITDDDGKPLFTLRIPAQQASNFAVALVNAANGV